MFSALNTNMLRFCVILFFIHEIVPVKIDNVNIPYQVEDGESATLTCPFTLNERETASHVDLRWWRIMSQFKRDLLYQKLGSSDPTYLKKSFKNITSTDIYSITLSELHPENSGTFECEVYTPEDEHRISGKLTVFTKGSGPVLNVRTLEQNITSETSDDENKATSLLVECQVIGVSPKPDLEIKTDTKTNILNITESLEGPINGRYNITKQITLNLDDADEAEFICELFYEDVKISHPAYVDTVTYKSSGEMVTEPEQETQADATTEDPVDVLAGDSSNPLDKSTLLMITFTILAIGNTYLCWQP